MSRPKEIEDTTRMYNIKVLKSMKKSVLSVALVAAMFLGTASVCAQTPVKKEVKTEQTATAKKAKAEKKDCKKECAKKCDSAAPSTKAEKKAPK